MNSDTTATLAGGGVGLVLLNSVKFDIIAHGELLKLGVALFLIVAGYFMYRPSNPKQ